MKKNNFDGFQVDTDHHNKLNQKITRTIILKSMRRNIIIVTVAILGSALFAHFLSQWMN